jgi:hypothetical protein
LNLVAGALLDDQLFQLLKDDASEGYARMVGKTSTGETCTVYLDDSGVGCSTEDLGDA